jgi:PAS domain S-box-containing protein/diguanylate cyclase (GGDEF)-like protein
LKSLSRHILEQIVSSSTQGILLIDARGPDLTIAYANTAYAKLSDYSAAQLEGMSWRSILAGDDANPELAKVRLAVGCAEPCEATIPYYRKDGTTWLANVSIRPLSSAHGEISYFLAQHEATTSGPKEQLSANVQVDLLQRALGHARQKIVSLDRTDPVSGLLRYEYFLSQLKRDLGVARRDRRALTILVVEIVELEVYRQTFGANAADSCLRMIGAQIAGAFRRAGDLCARCDETTFVVAVPNQDADHVAPPAARVAEKVRNLGLHNPRAQSGRYLTIRSAIVGADVESEDAETLVTRARSQLAKGPIQLQQPA